MQLLTPEGERVSHPDYDVDLTDDEYRELYRDLVLVRRIDVEATALYDLVEHEVAPRFYDVDRDGVPDRWVAMVRHTLKSLGPKVLASRMVRDYVARLYAPAATTARLLQGGPRQFTPSLVEGNCCTGSCFLTQTQLA